MPLVKTPKELRKEKEEKLTLKCPKCGNNILAELKVGKFISTQTESVGTALPHFNQMHFSVYMCVKKDCGNIIIPALDTFATAPSILNDFNEMADVVEGKDGPKEQ